MIGDRLTLYRASGSVWSTQKDEELVYEVVRTTEDQAKQCLLDDLHELRGYDTGSESVERVTRFVVEVPDEVSESHGLDMTGLLTACQERGLIESKEVVYERH